MAQRPYNRGDKVEVKMREGEYAGGTYGGVIMAVWNHWYEPVPPRILVEYKQFDLVEVWHKRGWWPAVIISTTPQNQFLMGLAVIISTTPMWHYYKL
ncbi:hypothetical protein L1887_40446 [Cichorium endivia]|nr:hypothetical protein L1887_40446 [Cichorium endivia]